MVGGPASTLVPVSVERYVAHGPLRAGIVRARAREAAAGLLGDLVIQDLEGAIIATLEGLRLLPLPEVEPAPERTRPRPRDPVLHVPVWRPAPLGRGPGGGPGSAPRSASESAPAIVCAPPLGDEPATCTEACTLVIAQALAADRQGGRLWVRVDGSLVGEALRGLVRTLARELPGLRPVAIEADDAGLAAAIEAGDPEIDVRITARGREVLELADGAFPLRGEVAGGRMRGLRRGSRPSLHGRWLVTGGNGGIGQHIARRLAARGAEVIRCARRASPGVEACDVTDPDALAALLGRLGPLAGVVHAAGVADDVALARLTPARLAAVLAPKVQGASNLDRLTTAPLVLISSAAAALGSPGQAAYTAANAWMDGLARARRARGRPGVSLAFGPWREVGMARGRSADLLARGVDLLDPDEALDLFEALLGGPPHVVLAALRRPTVARPASGDLAELVRRRVIEVLGRAPQAPLDARAGFAELGMDSIMAVELRSRLQGDLGRPLPGTLALDHPNLDALVAFLARDGAPETGTARSGNPVLTDLERPSPGDPSPGDPSPGDPGDPSHADPSDGDPSLDPRVTDIAAMSEDDVEALLLGKLAELGA